MLQSVEEGEDGAESAATGRPVHPFLTPAVSDLYEKLANLLRTFQFAGDFCRFGFLLLLLSLLLLFVLLQRNVCFSGLALACWKYIMPVARYEMP